ncbi:phosphate-binding protein [Streptomyces sp. MUSC 125]|uniref:phosphate ABC transporter substrate-binding protein PstS n=1 Tax=Streptomyces TaxID=1883 RepID=UPI00057350DB|nr:MULTISPECIES: phosphate ABC transporter substrate-binding protein PstS [Streptomyces]KIE25134.1 phosphate-binding protein [Streptomyces sp. MUSC 125]MCH0560169.1 phosphate ABC transporter substrate-binding protein PstS [Streptomyces sp. MUM 16J]
MKLQRKNRLRALSLGAVAVSGALALTACGSDNNNDGASSTSSASAKAAGSVKCDNAKGNLLASGSTAQQNAMGQWSKDFMGACSGVQINYKGVGSGAGIQEFLQGNTAFAGSDSALKPEEITQSKKVCSGGQAIDLPMVGGPIAIIYNLDGVDNLTLDAPTLAKIFDSKIKKWNDPAIAKLNPGVKLPDLAIQAYHRTEDSGTTDNFTKYLKAAAPSDWKYSGGKSWQAKGGQSAQGSSGVAAGVKQTNGAIGYDELSYATSNKLQMAQLNTGAAQPVALTTDSASKAIAAAKIVGTNGDLSLQLDYATKADGAWPIVLVTYEIVCDKGNKADTLPTTKAFLNYISSEDAQSKLADQSYAPLPTEIATKVRSAISNIS